MSLLSRLFGGRREAEPTAAPSESYQGYTITPDPIAAGGEFRIAAVIEKDGRRHELIRADTLRDREAAVAASLGKARQVIDEQGESIFR
ncbi:HlyU family transcriptional regulator [Jannaschia ovalis]|uniref:HlyU family transcriptional regulator n=1 Tax=Jannaschia ovalis TaxID=3038773 RepID=A0ABY8LDA4_9RHOB|nr:HlyU family transcriptional regulator [Jannaschia sp. GRR-S6-38]WGH79298.1 HlyU family transcriptional regulator [Jannaschia sp. GRR-S6-38]